MLRVSENICLEESELQFKFIRASGPGGQNVNKVASAVQLRFDVRATRALSEPQKQRLTKLAGQRMSEAGVLQIDARRFRSQERNREDALARLFGLIQKAEDPPVRRKKTKPSPAAKKKRLEEKRQIAQRKHNRRAVSQDD